MKKIILLLSISLFYSCSEKSFFSDFDQVEYYSINNEKILDETENDSIFEKLIYADFPNSLNDANFNKYLESNNFKKFTIIKKDLAPLKEIFSKKNSFSSVDSGCVPTYRDVLIFKLKNKTIGIAKICFDCELYYFLGNNPKISTDKFGDNEEFEKLKLIFQTYK